MPHHGKDEGADRVPAVLSTLNLSLALSAKLLLLQHLARELVSQPPALCCQAADAILGSYPSQQVRPCSERALVRLPHPDTQACVRYTRTPPAEFEVSRCGL
jgi:hypothetical protein